MRLENVCQYVNFTIFILCGKPSPFGVKLERHETFGFILSASSPIYSTETLCISSLTVFKVSDVDNAPTDTCPGFSLLISKQFCSVIGSATKFCKPVSQNTILSTNWMALRATEYWEPEPFRIQLLVSIEHIIVSCFSPQLICLSAAPHQF